MKRLLLSFTLIINGAAFAAAPATTTTTSTQALEALLNNINSAVSKNSYKLINSSSLIERIEQASTLPANINLSSIPFLPDFPELLPLLISKGLDLNNTNWVEKIIRKLVAISTPGFEITARFNQQILPEYTDMLLDNLQALLNNGANASIPIDFHGNKLLPLGFLTMVLEEYKKNLQSLEDNPSLLNNPNTQHIMQTLRHLINNAIPRALNILTISELPFANSDID